MSSTKFIAILPKPIEEKDKILISGKLIAYAKEFSINFANEIDEDPQSVTYRFKCDLVNNLLIEGYKENDQWMDCKETQLDALDGRFKNYLAHTNKAFKNDSISEDFLNTNSVISTTDTFVNANSYSLLGLEFALEFGFQDDSIYVYGDGHNSVTIFQPENSFDSIQSIQVCGDLDKITNLTFSYS